MVRHSPAGHDWLRHPLWSTSHQIRTASFRKPVVVKLAALVLVVARQGHVIRSSKSQSESLGLFTGVLVEVGPSRCTSSFGTVASGKTSSGIVAWSGSAQLLLIRLVCVDNGINRSSIGCKIIWPLLCLFLMKA